MKLLFTIPKQDRRRKPEWPFWPRKKDREEERVPQIYVTGDKHRDFRNLIRFCKKNKTSPADTVVILGDACFNYYGDERDDKLKQTLAKAKVTLFCIHGNKENRPRNIGTYLEKSYRGGTVFYEAAYPNILFAQDCGIYDFGGYSAVVIGGAHSVDKLHRLETSQPFWFDEEPSEAVKRRFERVMKRRRWEIDYVFSHTVPYKYEPTEVFLSNQRKKKKAKPKRRTKGTEKEYVLDIDKSVEIWLDQMEDKIDYRRWFAGHYHTDKMVDRIVILQDGMLELTGRYGG